MKCGVALVVLAVLSGAVYAGLFDAEYTLKDRKEGRSVGKIKLKAAAMQSLAQDGDWQKVSVTGWVKKSPWVVVWVVLGFLGQLVFSLRFIVQWVASERRGKSYVPVVFWYISLVGTFILLSYAIYRQDPVFIAGQAAGIVVYVRNLMLIWRAPREAAA